MDPKIFFVAAAVLIASYNYTRYVRSTLKGEFRPHMFSWGIWSLLSIISFAAQWSENAGPGMWQTAFMAAGTLIIAVVSYFGGERNYTRSDWIALVTALLAIPLWLATDNPLWSVIVVTAIDAVALWPTVRKSWNDPHKESIGVFFLAGLVCALGFAALENLNWTTGLYQGALVALNWGLVLMILLRRRSRHAEC